MGSDFPIFEIIIFGMIAAFFVLRLKNTLGKRTGHEQEEPPTRIRQSRDQSQPSGPAAGDDNVIRLPGAENAANDQFEADDDEPATPLDRALREIRQADSSFDPRGFVEGARGAYEMIVTAFAAGDRETLKMLLSPEVLQNFVAAIDEREEAGHAMETTVVSLDKADIVEAELKGKVAEITVKFVSEMISVTRDSEGENLPGQSPVPREVTDIWTFARDANARDPNWLLVETRSEN